MDHLATLPAFLTWFPLCALLLAAFAAVYIRVTPWAELRLIRAGNVAAAVSFSGAILGYALVVGSVMLHAVSRSDLIIWGIVGLVVQILAFFVARALLGGDLDTRMEEGQLSSGIMLASTSLAAGVLNAATMVF
ncbi:MAG: Membrane protein with domain [Rubritepida sp.]|nr:Membrane protein with domain [Rubritepida sp.]